jgi:hypothetical protein
MSVTTHFFRTSNFKVPYDHYINLKEPVTIKSSLLLNTVFSYGTYEDGAYIEISPSYNIYGKHLFFMFIMFAFAMYGFIGRNNGDTPIVAACGAVLFFMITILMIW